MALKLQLVYGAGRTDDALRAKRLETHRTMACAQESEEVCFRGLACYASDDLTTIGHGVATGGSVWRSPTKDVIGCGGLALLVAVVMPNASVPF